MKESIRKKEQENEGSTKEIKKEKKEKRRKGQREK